MNVLVVFGGESFEHEVSIISGCLVNNLLKDTYKVFPVYINKDNDIFYLKECDIDTFRKNKLSTKVNFIKNGFRTKLITYKMDIAIICNHGINGEDGMMKSILNFYNIPSIGSNLISSAVNMDKYFSYCILKQEEINVVNSTFITKNNINHNIEYPVILKPARLGSSIGIKVCLDELEYLENVNEFLKFDSKILVQKYLEDITELNISLYKNKQGIVTSKIEVVDKHESIYSYEDKYSKNDLKRRKFLNDENLINEINKISIKAYELFELDGIVRIDYILHNEEIYLNEINTIPGSLSYYLYDLEFSEIIKQVITKELYDVMNRNCYVFTSDILFYDYNMKK